MEYNTWSKGSQWRKWDLHVHTPASFHWNGGKLLREMNDEERDSSFQELFNAIEKADVAVFCFTDYWTFDGYLQFKDFLQRKDLHCPKTVFPGIELRVEAPANYRLNMQVIFSDSLSKQDLEDFKSKLTLTIGTIAKPLSDDAILAFAKSLDASKAKVHGFNDPKSLSNLELMKLGSATIEVTKESLYEAMKTVVGNAYIVLPFDTDGGLAKLDWKTQPHAANFFMQISHIAESRKDETVDLFLGVETEKNRGFIENFRKTLNHVQKPVICGSDAHRYTDYGKYPDNRATWIKADPTFQGFKQIIYEPRDRVRIQEIQPEGKITYRVIEKIRFVDKTDKPSFSDEWIELNENLNTIVGGKSSGKSLLLYHVAKTIAPELVAKRSKEAFILDYKFGNTQQFDFEVAWKDGHLHKLSVLPEHDAREIEYIPQMYVNALAEKEGRDSLYELVKSILKQNSSYRDFIQQQEQEITTLETGIDQDVVELLRLRGEAQRLGDERRAIGELPGITKEIEGLRARITVLREETDFSPDENKFYENLFQRRLDFMQKKKLYDELGYALSSFVQTLEQSAKTFVLTLEKSSVSMGLGKFHQRVLSVIKRNSIGVVSSAINALVETQKALVDLARVKAKKSEEKAKLISDQLKPYTEKINDQKQLQSLESQLKTQDEILSAYNAKNTQVENVTTLGLKTKEDLLEKYSKLLVCYQEIVERLGLDEYSKIDNDIVLEASLQFDVEGFSKSFCSVFDLRRSFISVFGSCFNENNEFIFNEATHFETVKGIFSKLPQKVGAEIKFKKGVDQNVAIRQLFKDYFWVEYNLRYKNDDILDMSPGKRGLVLLQLILHISNATHPILIDQPEDNLDNRTISNELRQFIANKKLNRQIIMVTHDANLVVLTDAENVIVSNQSGQQANRENAAFRFEYVAGALETSFRLPDDQAVGKGVLYSCGIREHVCDILEGGEAAFKKREEKYGFTNR